MFAVFQSEGAYVLPTVLIFLKEVAQFVVRDFVWVSIQQLAVLLSQECVARERLLGLCIFVLN